jgi:hypothetical protein
MKKWLSACFIALTGLLVVTAQSQTAYQFTLGEAQDIAVGGDGSVWAVGMNQQKQGGFGIFKKNGSSWEEVSLAGVTRYNEPLGAVRMAVDADGNPWIVTAITREIYRRVRGNWGNLGGNFIDIGIGANGQIWAISGAGDDNRPYAWVGSKWVNYKFEKLPCALRGDYKDNCERIAVDADGNIWVVDKDQELYRSTDMSAFFNAIQRGTQGVVASFVKLPGQFTDVGAGADNTVFAVSSVPFRGGGQVFKWNANDWIPQPVGATDVAVDGNGYPWLVNSSYKILTDSRNSEPATLKDTILPIGGAWIQNKQSLNLRETKYSTEFGGTVAFTLEFTNQNLTPVAVQYNLSDLAKLVSNGKTYSVTFGQSSKCSAISEQVAPGATVRLKCTNDALGVAVFPISDSTIKEFVLTVAEFAGIQNARWIVPVKR